MRQGTLAILRGSHRFGVLPIEFHMGPGNRQAVVPPEMREGLTWVTHRHVRGRRAAVRALTVHAVAAQRDSVRCASRSTFGSSVEGEELTDQVLEPHFGRLSWEEIYAGWKSEEHQYYWRDLDYEFVPFDRAPFEASEPTREEIVKVLLFDKARRQKAGRRTPAGSA